MKTNHGFSLIEVVLSVGMLGIIVLLVSGVFTRFIALQRHDIAQQALQEDVRLALELFSREARTAYASTFAVVNGEGSALTFRNQNGDCVLYQVNPTTRQLERGEVKTGGTDCDVSNFDNASLAAVTSRDTRFEVLRFDPVRSQANQEGLPDRQGMITVIIEAVSRRDAEIQLDLQTTVASRQMNLFEPL